MQADIVKLGNTLPVILHRDSSSVSVTVGVGTVGITVDEVGSGVNDRVGSLDSLCLDIGEREFLGLTGLGGGRLGVPCRVGVVQGAEVRLDGPWTVDGGLGHGVSDRHDRI